MGASSTRSLRSSILPRVMRLMSSRSSTSRAIWPTWRSSISDAERSAFAVAAAQAQGSRGVADRRQRVAQLVRQHRQELVLAAVGLGQIRRQAAQVVFQPLSLGHVLATVANATGRPAASGSVSTL